MSPLLEQIIHDNFFYICSDNFREYQSAFYGYALDDNRLLLRTNPSEKIIDKYSYGVFVNIVATEESILIQQDFFGGFGLYLYREGPFWALSNSFYHMLQKLDHGHKLTINEDYLSLFLVTPVVPPSITETAIKEINELAQSEYILINKKTGVLSVQKNDYDLYSIDIYNEKATQLTPVQFLGSTSVWQSSGRQALSGSCA